MGRLVRRVNGLVGGCMWHLSMLHPRRAFLHPHTTPTHNLTPTPTPHPNPPPRECKDEVTNDMNRAATDYRLNWRLNHACAHDIGALCAGLCATSSNQPCGGVVLHCLSEKQENITSTECQEVGFGVLEGWLRGGLRWYG